MSLFLARVAGTLEQYSGPGRCQVWTLVAILESVGVEKALTGLAGAHLFYHGRVEISDPSGVSFPSSHHLVYQHVLKHVEPPFAT